MNWLRKMQAVLADGGFSGLLRTVHNHLRPHEFVLLVRGLKNEGSSNEDHTSICVEKGDLARLQEWRRSQKSPPRPFFGDVRNGWDTFWWALYGDQPVCVVWVTPINPLIVLEQNETSFVDLYTFPTYRGRGLGKALLATACEDLRRSGVQRVFAVTESSNIASQKAFRASGFEALETYEYWWPWTRRLRPLCRNLRAVDASVWGDGFARGRCAEDLTRKSTAVPRDGADFV